MLTDAEKDKLRDEYEIAVTSGKSDGGFLGIMAGIGSGRRNPKPLISIDLWSEYPTEAECLMIQQGQYFMFDHHLAISLTSERELPTRQRTRPISGDIPTLDGFNTAILIKQQGLWKYQRPSWIRCAAPRDGAPLIELFDSMIFDLHDEWPVFFSGVKLLIGLIGELRTAGFDAHISSIGMNSNEPSIYLWGRHSDEFYADELVDISLDGGCLKISADLIESDSCLMAKTYLNEATSGLVRYKSSICLSQPDCFDVLFNLLGSVLGENHAAIR